MPCVHLLATKANAARSSQDVIKEELNIIKASTSTGKLYYSGMSYDNGAEWYRVFPRIHTMTT